MMPLYGDAFLVEKILWKNIFFKIIKRKEFFVLLPPENPIII